VRNAQGVELVSNVCRHRQAVMLRGRGHAGANIVCPLHRWTYGLDGKLLGAPHFAQDPCVNLRNYPVQNWNGLLFEGNGADVVADLAGLGQAAQTSTSRATCTTAPSSTSATTTGRPSSRSTWRTTTSAPSIPAWAVRHLRRPALGDGRAHSVQTVGVARTRRWPRPARPYRRWQDQLLRYQHGGRPRATARSG
jgi:choline monooxygenase